MSAIPIDGPSTQFYADPLVISTYEGESAFFNLVLVAGWPFAMEQIDRPYQEFIGLVRTCFDPDDLAGDHPNVYLYNAHCLHITVATFFPICKKATMEGEDEHLANKFKHLLQAASQLPEWPTQPLQFKLASTQLGTKAGILLWNELTGGMDKMRQCLQQQSETLQNEWKIHNIPNIVHSTFLRFSKEPITNGQRLQESYQAKVVSAAAKLFQEPVVATSVKLISESIPYWHMEDDGIVHRIPLAGKSS